MLLWGGVMGSLITESHSWRSLPHRGIWVAFHFKLCVVNSARHDPFVKSPQLTTLSETRDWLKKSLKTRFVGTNSFDSISGEG